MYRSIIVLYSVSEKYVQWQYCTTFFVTAVCTVSLLSCSLSLLCVQGQFSLQSLSVRFVQGNYCTVICVSAVCTGVLFYCSLCHGGR